MPVQSAATSALVSTACRGHHRMASSPPRLQRPASAAAVTPGCACSHHRPQSTATAAAAATERRSPPNAAALSAECCCHQRVPPLSPPPMRLSANTALRDSRQCDIPPLRHVVTTARSQALRRKWSRFRCGEATAERRQGATGLCVEFKGDVSTSNCTRSPTLMIVA